MGPGVFVTSWPYIRRTLVNLSGSIVTNLSLATAFRQAMSHQRGGVYPPRTRLGEDQRGEGRVKITSVFRDVWRRHLTSSEEQGRTSRR